MLSAAFINHTEYKTDSPIDSLIRSNTVATRG